MQCNGFGTWKPCVLVLLQRHHYMDYSLTTLYEHLCLQKIHQRYPLYMPQIFKSLRSTRGTSISRQQLLMRQFHEAGCHVVGVQETRHRHLQDVANPYYHMVGAPATSSGQDGVLWVSKTLPLYEGEPAISARMSKSLLQQLPASL